MRRRTAALRLSPSRTICRSKAVTRSLGKLTVSLAVIGPSYSRTGCVLDCITYAYGSMTACPHQRKARDHVRALEMKRVAESDWRADFATRLIYAGFRSGRRLA